MQTVSISAPQQIVQRSIPLLERQMDDAVAGRPPAVELVLTQVQLVDSSGLNWLLALQSRLESLNVRLVLVDPSPIVADVLIATRLDSRFAIESAAITGAGHVGG